jgi:multiple sugar transport system ATP-binding protein
MTEVPPHKRNTAMVFQSYALFPHMSVAQNVAFGLKMRNLPAAEQAARIEEALEMVSLRGLESRRPGQLSGGQQQRVALARAIVTRPDILLFDEPLSNLDAKLRVAMRAEVKELHQRLKTTTVYVTHDQIEAMTMADRIVVMHDGIVEQIGTPLDLYDRPDNLFVAQFIGSPAMNVLPGTLRRNGSGAYVEALGERWPVPTSVAGTDGQAVSYGIRPGDLSLAPNGIAAKVFVVEPTGAETEMLLQVGDAQLTLVMHGRTQANPDDTVHLGVDPAQAHVFDQASGRRLN